MDMNVRGLRIEHEILSHVSQALNLAVQAPIQRDAAAEWLERVAFLGESFARHISRLFAIEEDGGYMSFIVDSPQPTLAIRVDALREEHRSLEEDLEATLVDVRAARPENLANLHGLRQRLNGFLHRFDEHRRQECELFFEAFLVDIGGEG